MGRLVSANAELNQTYSYARGVIRSYFANNVLPAEIVNCATWNDLQQHMTLFGPSTSSAYETLATKLNHLWECVAGGDIPLSSVATPSSPPAIPSSVVTISNSDEIPDEEDSAAQREEPTRVTPARNGRISRWWDSRTEGQKKWLGDASAKAVGDVSGKMVIGGIASVLTILGVSALAQHNTTRLRNSPVRPPKTKELFPERLGGEFSVPAGEPASSSATFEIMSGTDPWPRTHEASDFVEIALHSVPEGAYLHEIQINGLVVLARSSNGFDVNVDYECKIDDDERIYLRPKRGWGVDSYVVTVLLRGNNGNIPLKSDRFLITQILDAENVRFGASTPNATVLAATNVRSFPGVGMVLSSTVENSALLLFSRIYRSLRNYSIRFSLSVSKTAKEASVVLESPGGLELRIHRRKGGFYASIFANGEVVRRPDGSAVTCRIDKYVDLTRPNNIWLSYDGDRLLVFVGDGTGPPILKTSALLAGQISHDDLLVGAKSVNCEVAISQIRASTFLNPRH